MTEYLELLERVMRGGQIREDRTGVGTRSLFGERLEVRLEGAYLPMITCRKISFKTVEAEVLWFLRGERTTDFMRNLGVNIWEPWAKKGWVGPVYGFQWRRWPVRGGWVDQLAQVVGSVEANPWSRRLLVSAWNVEDLPEMALPPCHVLFQLYTEPSEESALRRTAGLLSMQVYMRSVDLVVGMPHDLAGYGLLLHIIAALTKRQAHRLIFVLGDAHVYRNHEEAARELLRRGPKDNPPRLVMTRMPRSIDDVRPKDFAEFGYNSWPGMRLEVAV